MYYRVSAPRAYALTLRLRVPFGSLRNRTISWRNIIANFRPISAAKQPFGAGEMTMTTTSIMTIIYCNNNKLITAYNTHKSHYNNILERRVYNIYIYLYRLPSVRGRERGGAYSCCIAPPLHRNPLSTPRRTWRAPRRWWMGGGVFLFRSCINGIVSEARENNFEKIYIYILYIIIWS